MKIISYRNVRAALSLLRLSCSPLCLCAAMSAVPALAETPSDVPVAAKPHAEEADPSVPGRPDSAQEQSNVNNDDEAARQEELYHLREENRLINDVFDLTTYQVYRANPKRIGGNLGTTGSLLQSEGGVEAAYRVPYIGYVDGRILQVFTRMLWANDNDMVIKSDSLQGGAGVRYKPLKEQNLYVSFERLFSIGADADNTFLLRAQYGLQYGNDIEIGRKLYYYSLTYADLGYFASGTTNLAFYGEVRQGLTFNIDNAFMISPHLIIDGRAQSHETNDLSYLEGGPGVSFRLPFNETKYEAYRSSAELLIQYRANFINASNGVVVTGVIRF